MQDEYMASVEKQLLGTETTRALRAKGVKSLICGLSANDMKDIFLENGANDFIMKPIPCDENTLRIVLRRLVQGIECPSGDVHATDLKEQTD
jgi:PleD family two-component response regulator